jgi:hypothetical protein
MRVLEIPNSSMKPKEAVLVADSLLGHKHLQRLDLSGNHQIGTEGRTSFISAAVSIDSLRDFCIRGVHDVIPSFQSQSNTWTQEDMVPTLEVEAYTNMLLSKFQSHAQLTTISDIPFRMLLHGSLEEGNEARKIKNSPPAPIAQGPSSSNSGPLTSTHTKPIAQRSIPFGVNMHLNDTNNCLSETKLGVGDSVCVRNTSTKSIVQPNSEPYFGDVEALLLSKAMLKDIGKVSLPTIQQFCIAHNTSLSVRGIMWLTNMFHEIMSHRLSTFQQQHVKEIPLQPMNSGSSQEDSDGPFQGRFLHDNFKCDLFCYMGRANVKRAIRVFLPKFVTDHEGLSHLVDSYTCLASSIVQHLCIHNFKLKECSFLKTPLPLRTLLGLELDIVECDLSGQDLNHIDIVAICSFLQHNRSLQTLDLRKNKNLCAGDGEYIGNFLLSEFNKGQNTQGSHVSRGMQGLVAVSGIEHVQDFVSRSSLPKNGCLDYNRLELSDFEVGFLSILISQHPMGINQISLQSNRISMHSVPTLMKGLSCCCNLRHIDLSDNNLSGKRGGCSSKLNNEDDAQQKGLQAIAKCISALQKFVGHDNILDLILNNNLLRQQVADELQDAIKWGTWVREDGDGGIFNWCSSAL